MVLHGHLRRFFISFSFNSASTGVNRLISIPSNNRLISSKVSVCASKIDSCILAERSFSLAAPGDDRPNHHQHVFLPVAKDFIGPLNQCRRHTGHPCHMDTKAMCASPGCQLAKKDDLIADFLIGDMIIFYSGNLFFQLIQFMIMRSKKSFGLAGNLMQIFGNAPCNGNTIIGRSTAADFIQQDKTSIQ